MKMSTRQQLRQRAEYTHKHNIQHGRHGWLRLTPAYSVKIVEELIANRDRPIKVFDPFSGTGTTALCAAYHGLDAVTMDINPFLVWFCRIKTAHYSNREISLARNASHRVIELISRSRILPASPPCLYNIERWWAPNDLSFLCTLRAAINEVTQESSPQHDLLLVSFCRTLIAISNVAFNHQSMGFKESNQPYLSLEVNLINRFVQDVDCVLTAAADNPIGTAEVILGDSRSCFEYTKGPFELLITSPPYANRMSYIRELRPYMYWLGFLSNGRDAGELDWSAIGGTWGIATSRLAEWMPEKKHVSIDLLNRAVTQIACGKNKSGLLLSKYVEKYFHDIALHFKRLTPVLARNAEVHYIVGNSTFYGVLLPVEKIYAAILQDLGFVEVECRPIRKRNSKKELIEFDVRAIWPH